MPPGGDARYLESKTVGARARDYYLTPDGELAQAPGRWLADAETLERLGIEAGGRRWRGLIALIEGRHPVPAVARPRRRRPWRRIDVTFSAPKSVSTASALGTLDSASRSSEPTAVGRQTIHHLREQVSVVQRRYNGQVVEEHAKDVIATDYRHATARETTVPASDPQERRHVLITGAVRDDDRIVAVASRPIFAARASSCVLSRSLAQELVREKFAIEQGTGKNGRYFEIKGVPREPRCVPRSFP